MALRKRRRSVFGTVLLALLLILFAAFMALPVIYTIASLAQASRGILHIPPADIGAVPHTG